MNTMAHSIEEVRKEFRRLDRLCGIDSSGVEIVFSGRAERRLGSFRYPRDGGDGALRITINSRLLTDETAFWDTVRHEYAHAAAYLRYPGRHHGHDRVWKDICREIGCPPERLAAMDEEARAELEARAKYKLRCRDCGRESLYMREGKAVKLMKAGQGGRLRCAACGGNSLELYTRRG